MDQHSYSRFFRFLKLLKRNNPKNTPRRSRPKSSNWKFLPGTNNWWISSERANNSMKIRTATIVSNRGFLLSQKAARKERKARMAYSVIWRRRPKYSAQLGLVGMVEKQGSIQRGGSGLYGSRLDDARKMTVAQRRTGSQRERMDLFCIIRSYWIKIKIRNLPFLVTPTIYKFNQTNQETTTITKMQDSKNNW